MNTIERVMRVMTHVNIGAGLAMAVWVGWSGLLVVRGEWKVPGHPALTRAVERPLEDRRAGLPCCFVAAEQRNPVRHELQVQRDAVRVLAQAEAGRAP